MINNDQIDIFERNVTIDHILHIVEIDDFVCKRFDDVGCMYINYENGKLYRHNGIFYYISYISDVILMYDEDMSPLYYDVDISFYGENRDWCFQCDRTYLKETGVKRFLSINTFLENKEKDIQYIISIDY